MRIIRIATALASLAAPLHAGCLIDVAGAKCERPGEVGEAASEAKWLSVTPVPPRHAVGDVLPRGRYNLVLNTAYYGLDPVGPGWLYFRVEGELFRVDRDSMEILERVTAEAARSF